MSQRYTKYIRVIVAVLSIATISIMKAQAQRVKNSSYIDSTIVKYDDGKTIVKYSTKPYKFGEILQKGQSQIPSEEEKRAFLETEITERCSPTIKGKALLRSNPSFDYSLYSVGEIPISEGVGPTGARTYQIPIATAKGFNLIPSISVGYNSQAGTGWLGYGWDIQGLSSITLINKNFYYHDEAKGANTNSTDAVFALDGVPLVTNTQPTTLQAYPLITSTGNILAAPTFSASGYVTSFTVKYPNGITAEYGIGMNSNSSMPSYPITQMTDIDGNRITFTYISEISNGNDRISSIKYGYDSLGQYTGEITFNYENNPSFVTRYYAGKAAYKNYRITSITSKTDNSIICHYTFSYEQNGNIYLLNQVGCTSDGEELRPLAFEYGPLEGNPPSSDYLYKDINPLLLSTAYISDDDEFIYRRGKFVSGSYNDGLLMLPLFSNYDILEYDGGTYKFGSLYPSDQEILIAPSLTDISTVYNTIVTGNGFQTIEAVDVDGDGLDEIVKVNTNGTSGSNTKLLITVYKCNSSGVPVVLSQFNVLIKGRITSGDYHSPYRREYFWGDFRGNGKIQLLTVAYDKNYNSSNKEYSQTSYAALIELSSGAKLFDDKIFDFTWNDYPCLLTCDLDNDLQTELCFATDSGLDVYRLTQPVFTFTKERTISNLTSSILSTPLFPYCVTDLNGDGYIDIMRPSNIGSNPYWYRYAFNGETFVVTMLNLSSLSEGDNYMFIDVNQDGLADFVKASGTSLYTYMNIDGSSLDNSQLSPSSINNTKGIIPCNVIDFYGSSCFIKLDGFLAYRYKYTTIKPTELQLTKSVDSFGRMTVNSYEYLPNRSLFWNDTTFTVDNSAGYAFRTLPIYVLEGENAYMTEYTDSDRYKSIYYSYFNGVIHNYGLGFCGFSKIRSCNYATGLATEIIDETHDPQKRGVVTSVEARHNSLLNNVYHTLTNTYDNNTTTYGKLNPRLTGSISCDSLTSIRTQTGYSYDSYDLPLTINTSRRVGAGTEQTENLTRTYENCVTPSKYVLGIVKEEVLDKNTDGDDHYIWREKSVTTHDGNFHPLTNKRYAFKKRFLPHHPDPIVPIIDTTILTLSNNFGTLSLEDPDEPDDPGEPDEPDDPDDPGEPGDPIIPSGPTLVSNADNIIKETRWLYDSHGNVISEKSAPYGTEEFVGNTYTYDNNGRFLLTKTDALGHTTTFGSYNKYGKPLLETDYRNRNTEYIYDAWGNLVRTKYADSTIVQKTMTWGGAGLFTATETRTNQPEHIVHFDALGREIKSGVKRFDSQWQWTDKEYDRRGRVSRASLPYRAESTIYWNNYVYDEFGRPISFTEASGKVSTWSYNGTSVTTVSDGITSTSTKDACGNVISVSDAGGTIYYALRDDGQPSSVTAPGDIETTFAYDTVGRRISITDPSAGIRTDAYEWYSDGSSVVTNTNPNGSVKTYKDKYGRTTLIERPGEYNTSYTYDAYGRISSILSTNGNGTLYTYDGFDRVISTTQTVPDGKLLNETITYGTGSSIESVTYASQDSVITSERYQYANGHTIGIILSDSTVVWRLTGENDLGMATSITSGSISREYGYTAFGLPTFRRMNGGNLQNLSYQFDATTGNLLMRSDGINNQAETFGYDNLNRLILIGNRHIVYSSTGNILSIDGVGEMTYGTPSRPYQITALSPEDDDLIPDRNQVITYTCYNRPSVLTEGGRSATFTYNEEGDRVKMQITNGSSQVITRYYIGGRYEYDQTPDGSKERLYLGGDAYSAPMVYQRENSGTWTAYNIGRDYLGNVTHIATLNGTKVAEYSYDPWGRLRNPVTLEIYASGSEPELFLGRGFTGHEHLTWFGLVNMNARLYDPVLGRFLSPDPYIQAPDFTQNFNRYLYCYGNPLKYVDKDGKFVWFIPVIIGAVVGAYTAGVAANKGQYNPFKWDYSSWKTWKYLIGGAIVGGISGYAGGAVSAAMAPQVASGGFLGGALSGAASGMASGFVSGTGMSLINGDNFKDALNTGINGAFWGGLGGAFFNGVWEGTRSLIKGDNFFYGSANKTIPLSPVEKGKMGESWAKDIVTSENGSISARQATFDIDGTRVRVDYVADFGGDQVLIEVKNGPFAGFTHNQSIAYPKIYGGKLPTLSVDSSIYNLIKDLPQPSVPITPVGKNAYKIWKSFDTHFEYKFIIIKF